MIVTSATTQNTYFENEIRNEFQSAIWDLVKLLIGVEQGNKKGIGKAESELYFILTLMGQQIANSPLSDNQKKLMQALVKNLENILSALFGAIRNHSSLSLIETLADSAEQEISFDEKQIEKIFSSNT